MGIMPVVLMSQNDPSPMTARDAACPRIRWRVVMRRSAIPTPDPGPMAGWKAMPGKGGNGSGGFSLIELLIAIALVAIVAAVSVPAFNRYSANADLKTAARAVAADLSSARQTAVTENLDVYRLTFNVGANSYALSRTDTGVTVWTKSVAVYGSGTVLTAVNFGGGGVVSFQNRGTMTSGSVSLRNNLASTAVVTVNFTGRTYVTFNMQ